ncbi:MAG: DUF7768 domain-containing protein [Thermoplasmataceae archaeon]
MPKKLIYICGKYTDVNKEKQSENVNYAREVAAYILLSGDIPVIPHAITEGLDFHELTKHKDHEFWLNEFCFPLLDRCDELLVLDNHHTSKGALAEIEYAKDKGIEINYLHKKQLANF